MPWPLARPSDFRSILLFLLIFQLPSGLRATPQWNNPNDFYSNSYQYQHGFMPTTAFGMNNQYGMNNNNNFGAFNRPFMTKPGSFVPYGNNFGATVSGGATPAAGTSQASHVEGSDETPPHTGSSTDTHLGPPSPPMSPSGNMPGMGSQVGSSTDSTTAHGSPPPTMPTGMQPMPGGGPMNNMNQMGMTGISEMMGNGYGAGMTNNNGGMNQWPGNLNMGMTNNFGGGNCYGPNCNQNFQGGPAMSPNGYDYPNGGNGGMGSNLGQNVGAEDYNSAEESAEIAGGEGIEQANLQRYAEYLNMVNRRYGIVSCVKVIFTFKNFHGMPGQVPNAPNQPNPANVIASGGAPQGTGTFSGMGMNTMGSMDMNGGMMPNFMGPMTNMAGMGGMTGMNNMNAMGGMDGLTTGGMPMTSSSNGITGGVSSVGTGPMSSNTARGMGTLMGRFSAQPSMGYGSGIVGYGSYMPSIPNIYDSQTYQPVQWPMSSGYGSGTLTNLAPSANTMGILDGYGPTGAIPAEYMGMSAMPAPTPYGYSGMQYPMTTQIYPQNIIPAIYQGVTPSGTQPTVSPELAAASKSKEKSSQESSATSREHIQSPPPATSIQALTQQIRRLPAVLYVDSKDSDGRRVENLLRDTYGLPLVSFYVDKIDKPKVVEKYLHQLTAHKGLPYLFICGTFIGSQEHVDSYHKNKQIPQLVEYVCGEDKDKKNSSGQRQSSHKDKKKKSGSRRHKSRRQSKP